MWQQFSNEKRCCPEKKKKKLTCIHSEHYVYCLKYVFPFWCKFVLCYSYCMFENWVTSTIINLISNENEIQYIVIAVYVFVRHRECVNIFLCMIKGTIYNIGRPQLTYRCSNAYLNKICIKSDSFNSNLWKCPVCVYPFNRQLYFNVLY